MPSLRLPGPQPHPLLALRSQAFPGPAPSPGLQLPLHSGGVGSPQRAGGQGERAQPARALGPLPPGPVLALWFPLLPWGWFDSLPLTFPSRSSRGVSMQTCHLGCWVLPW